VDTLISQRELRNDSGEIMRRVERGESFTVTRNGTPVADLVPHVSAPTAPPRFVAVETIAAGATALPNWRADLFADELQDLDNAVDDGDIDRWNAAG
jgi:prevent-host-death family protein